MGGSSFFSVSRSFYNEQVLTSVIRNKACKLCLIIFICLTIDGQQFLVVGLGLGWGERLFSG